MARARASAPYTGPQIKITGEAGDILSKCSRLTDTPRNCLASRWIVEAGLAEYTRLYNLLLTGTLHGNVDPNVNAPPQDSPPAPQPYDVEAPV